jgi:hypothetical protein
MSADEIIKAIGLIGLGGLLKSIIDYMIASKKAIKEARHTFKESRYKTIILLCFATANYEKEKSTLVINRSRYWFD